MDSNAFTEISLISSTISCVFVLITLVLGILITIWLQQYKTPKHWTRPWILISILCSYIANLIILYFCGRTASCLSVRVSASISVTSRLSVALLFIHMLISFYSPRYLIGKKANAIWAVLILSMWIIGPVVTLLYTSPLTSNNGHSAWIETTTTSGLWENKGTKSLLDALDIEFETELLQSSESTSVTHTTYVDETGFYLNDYGDDSDCLDNEQFLSYFKLITSLVLIVCGLFILLAVILHVASQLQKISDCFQGRHGQHSSSLTIQLNWIEQQWISSAIFIQILVVQECVYMACEYDHRDYCSIAQDYFRVLYPLVFSLSCLMLKEARIIIVHIYSFLKPCSKD